MEKKPIAATVREVVQPVADEQGLILWDVAFVKEGVKKILRITIDKPGGVTIDDCETFHRAIDPKIDEADPIEESYYLEVSSPGLERELRTDEHIRACTGERAQLRLYAPDESGAKVFTGTLRGLDGEGRIRIELADGIRAFRQDTVAKLRTVYDFDK